MPCSAARARARAARGAQPAYGALDDAIEVVRHVDAWYAGQLKALYADLDAAAPIDASGVIGWHRGELGAPARASRPPWC